MSDKPVLKHSLLRVPMTKTEAWHIVVVMERWQDSLSLAVRNRLRDALQRAERRERHRAFKLRKARSFRQESL